jgi:hypothetical protein
MAKRPRQAQSTRNQLPRWQRWGVYALSAGLVLSGAAWLWLEYFVRIQAEFGPEHSPWQHRSLIVHALLAWPALWLIGVLWSVHIRRGWRERRSRYSGATLLALFAVLSVSAMLLYYASDDRWRAISSVVHWALGLQLVLLLPLHIYWGRRAARVRAGVGPTTS